jgi:tRNA splicing ligase
MNEKKNSRPMKQHANTPNTPHTHTHAQKKLGFGFRHVVFDTAVILISLGLTNPIATGDK